MTWRVVLAARQGEMEVRLTLHCYGSGNLLPIEMLSLYNTCILWVAWRDFADQHKARTYIYPVLVTLCLPLST